MRQNKNEAGFIPLIILMLLIIAAIVWFAYSHVSNAHKKQVLQKASQYENSLSQ